MLPENAIIRSHKISFHLREKTELLKIFKLIFSKKDGSIFLTLPRLRDTEGIIAYSEIPAGTRSTNISMKEQGKVTSHIVKYSHHPDGIAQFSQDGKIYTVVKKQSEKLQNYDGHFCSITIQSPDRLVLDESEIDEEQISMPPYSSKDQVVAFNFDYKKLETFRFIFYYFPINNAKNYIKIPKSWVWSEPGLSAITENNKIIEQIFFISPNKDAIGADHVIMIRAAPVAKVSAEPRINFIGGFDPGNKQEDLSVPFGFLTLSYPVDDFKRLAKEIGSVDLPKDFKVNNN